MEAGWLLALILTPLFFNVYSSRVFEPDKIALLRSLALLVLAAWLIKLVSERGARFGNSRSPAEGFASWRSLFRLPLVAPVSALAGIYLISTLLSISPNTSLFGSYQRLQGTFTTCSYLVIFAAVAANLRQRAQVERILTTVILTSLPISLYGIVQHYRLDPLPWGGETTQRVTANMGNAIFLSAYLIMSAHIVLGRVVTTFRAILTEETNFARNMLRATSYVFILAVNLVAIWFTQSRGPLLGLLAGLFYFFVLLALHWRVRWLALGTIGLAGVLAAFLIVLNIPNGPLQSLARVPTMGRLSQMFDELEGRTGTGRVRVLIWGGVVRLMLPHPALQYPDGRPDRWNALRPLIGYGPEALYVAFNRFYPPELAQVEARNASPDRSHNETFDALAFTGLLGLGIHLALFVAVFYYGLKWLGLISARRRNVFLALVLGGGIVSAVGLILWQGPEFFGVGLPFGMLLGLIAFLALYALFPTSSASAESPPAGPPIAGPESWHAVALISLFAAIVAHFTEIHFGIAIVSTRTHFWIFSALMFVLGIALPGTKAVPSAASVATPASPVTTRRRQRTAARSAAASEVRRALESWRPALVGAGLTAVVLVTLGFDFISNPMHLPQAGRILIDSLTFLPAANRQSFAILGVVLLTWLVGGTVAIQEEMRNAGQPSKLPALGAGLGLAFALGGISWLALSIRLAAIASFAPATVPDLMVSAGNLAGVLAFLYVELFVLLVALAAWLPVDWPLTSRLASGMALVWYAVLPVTTVLLSIVLNLQVIQADIIYKTGQQFEDQGQPQLAILIYQQAIRLAEAQDYYYLFLGRSYLSATGTLTDTVQQNDLLNQAEKELIKARDLNPLNTDHTANLGRLNRQWAGLSTDPTVRAQRAATANEYYQQALQLSPNNAGLWNEWALLAYQLLNDPDTAQAKLDQSLALDKNYEQTYQIQGDLYVWRANQVSDAATKQDYLQKAIAVYSQGVKVAETRQVDTLNLRFGLAAAYASTNQLQPAIDEYLRIIQVGAGPSQWKVYRAVAELYRELGDIAQARSYGQLTLEAAPDSEKSGIQAWLNTLP